MVHFIEVAAYPDAQVCSVSKKRQGLSTKTEEERQEVAEEIRYVASGDYTYIPTN
jgi:hypothetical protein